jgi:hypothetical protein
VHIHETVVNPFLSLRPTALLGLGFYAFLLRFRAVAGHSKLVIRPLISRSLISIRELYR